MELVHEDHSRTGTTMTVGELRDALSNYDRDLPVIATWESVFAGFRIEEFSVDEINGRKQLTIDVENYG